MKFQQERFSTPDLPNHSSGVLKQHWGTWCCCAAGTTEQYMRVEFDYHRWNESSAASGVMTLGDTDVTSPGVASNPILSLGAIER